MRPPTKPATKFAHLIPSSLTVRAGVIALALVLIASLGVPLTPLPAGAQAQRRGSLELRDESTAWRLDQRTVTLSTPVGQTQKKGRGELRVEPPTWLLDHSTGTGRRVADIDKAITDSQKAGIKAPNRAEEEKYVGKLSTSRPAGYSPAQIRRAYGFDQLEADGRRQVIAIVIAFDYPNAAADLKTFIQTFRLKNMYGLPGRAPCTVAAGPHPCFQTIYATGTQPAFSSFWSVEGALDLQWSHAIAPAADILLVEAASDDFYDMIDAVDAAVLAGASVVSMSWGITEFDFESDFDFHFAHSGVTFLAATGDVGNETFYPAISPYVVGVGGTRLPLDRKGNRTGTETGWSGSGGGISLYEGEPGYQSSFPIPDTVGRRGNPDVALNADPQTGQSFYISHTFGNQTGWLIGAGTSVATPQWAGLIALANQLRDGGNLSSNNLINSPIYDAAEEDYQDNYRDIRSGTNGTCGPPVCRAVRGYDFVTGLGSPRANKLVEALAEQ